MPPLPSLRPSRRVGRRVARVRRRGASKLDVHPVRGQRLRVGTASRRRPSSPSPSPGGARRRRDSSQRSARAADALDVVDREDLVGLGHQHREPAGAEARDVVGLAGAAPERVGDRGHDPLDRPGPISSTRRVEAFELDDDDRRGAGDSGGSGLPRRRRSAPRRSARAARSGCRSCVRLDASVAASPNDPSLPRSCGAHPGAVRHTP